LEIPEKNPKKFQKRRKKKDFVIVYAKESVEGTSNLEGNISCTTI
jgi:hypothetical protein